MQRNSLLLALRELERVLVQLDKVCDRVHAAAADLVEQLEEEAGDA
jgi:hypothetical protein